jgi:hypothetical protein
LIQRNARLSALRNMKHGKERVMQKPSADHSSSGPLAALAARLRHWLENAEAQEFDQCGDDIRRIAADVGLDPGELRQIARLEAGAAAQLPQMLAALAIAEDQVRLDVMRDLERVCSLCAVKARCECALARGTAGATYDEFCPNAVTLHALKVEQSELAQA